MIYDLYDLSSQIGTRTINTNKNTQHIGLRLQTKMYASRPLTDHGLETQISGHIWLTINYHNLENMDTDWGGLTNINKY